MAFDGSYKKNWSMAGNVIVTRVFSGTLLTRKESCGY